MRPGLSLSPLIRAAVVVALGGCVACVLPAAARPIDGPVPTVDAHGGPSLLDFPGAPANTGGGPNAAAPVEAAPAFGRYIVVLDDPPVAEYRGGVGGLRPTAVDAVQAGDPSGARGVHLDVTSVAAREYIRHLELTQDRVINRIRPLAPELRVDWRYRLALNGFTAVLAPEHAARVMGMDGVKLVYPEETLEYEMDTTAQLIGTNIAWEAAGGPEEAGLGARLAILDTGADAAHPMFNDAGMPEPPDDFPVATLHGRNPGGGMDVLNYSDTQRAEWTNRKVIATRVFVKEATADTLNTTTPLAADWGDHGLHVAGTAGGRHGTYNIDVAGQSLPVTLGGIAPMAYVLHYVNLDNTPGMVAIYDQMIEDEIDVVNISQGHAGWLLAGSRLHPIAMAQTAAAKAGVMTVASSGNAGGNGRASLSGAWKYSEDILVVGNATSSGALDRQADISGNGVPEAAQRLLLAPYNSAAMTADITADVYLAANACAADAGASGKVVVNVYSTEAGTVMGACNPAARANFMLQSGAKALVLVFQDTYRGPIVIPNPTLTAGGVPINLPTMFAGRKGGLELLGWLAGGGSGQMTIRAQVARGTTDLPDQLAPSSSRGPGLDWSIKPDITAPGTNILSSRVTSSTAPDGTRVFNHFLGTMTGTSMSSPHVAGAVALIRSAHPDWTVAQVRSAIINNSAPTIQTGYPASQDAASTTDGGPGRLDLTHVIDPGAFLHPAKLNVGALPDDVSEDIEVTIESASEAEETWTIEVVPGGGDGEPEVDPMTVVLGPKATAEIIVSFDTAGLQDTEHWGHIELQRGDTEQTLRLPYFAYVDAEANRRDVMLINWTYGNTPNYASYYTDVLDALGLTYSVWNMGDTTDGLADRKTAHPPFTEMYRHDMVIFNGNMSPRSLQEFLAGQFQYQNYMLAGGNMLIAGQGVQGFWAYMNFNAAPLPDTPQARAAYPDTWPRQWYGPSQNQGCEMCLARYFAGFTPELTATLSGRLLVPFPTRPDEPEIEVVLSPHPDADGPFGYPLDISTGAKAPPGAAGNQYRFNSGDVMDTYIPTLSGAITSRLGDVGYAETVVEHIAPLARPLWSYPVTDPDGEPELNVVGTYVAGRQYPAQGVAWNAMYWGFGLEGVGAGAPGTVSRARLLGDTFNFLAHNLYATARSIGVVPRSESVAIEVEVSGTADEVSVAGVEVDWGDGHVDTETYPRPRVLPAKQTFTHQYARSGTYRITVKYTPAPDASIAPVFASTVVEVEVRPKGVYLPALLRDAGFGDDAAPTATPTVAAPTVIAPPSRED